MLLQLDLFQEYTEVEILEQRIKQLEKSMDKQRKALFARHGALCKQYMELNDRLDILERVLCKGKFGFYDGKER
jgi:hypothetical protein